MPSSKMFFDSVPAGRPEPDIAGEHGSEAVRSFDETGGDVVKLEFNPAEAMVTRSGNDLVFTFGDGTKLVIPDFFATGDEPLPKLELPDGVQFAAVDLLGALSVGLDTSSAPLPPENLYAEASGQEPSIGGVDKLDTLPGFDLASSVPTDDLPGIQVSMVKGSGLPSSLDVNDLFFPGSGMESGPTGDAFSATAARSAGVSSIMDFEHDADIIHITDLLDGGEPGFTMASADIGPEGSLFMDGHIDYRDTNQHYVLQGSSFDSIQTLDELSQQIMIMLRGCDIPG